MNFVFRISDLAAEGGCGRAIEGAEQFEDDGRVPSGQDLLAGIPGPRRSVGPINKTRLTLRSAPWPLAAGRPKAPPNPTVRDQRSKRRILEVEAAAISSSSSSSGSRGRPSRRKCSAAEP